MKRITVIAVLLPLLAAACGADDVGSAGPVTMAPEGGIAGEPPTSASPTSSETSTTTANPDTPGTEPDAPHVFVDLFFVKNRAQAHAVTRSVESPAVAANAIRALLEGPTQAERDQGLGTSVPADTLLLGLHISDGLATIDLSREFEAGGGSLSIIGRLAQVVYTLTQFPTVDGVTFRLDGEPVTVFSGDGLVLESPVGRADYETILPIASGELRQGPQRWEQDNLPAIEGVDASLLGRVVLVEDSDVLNVREGPGADARPVGTLSPDVVVVRTGLTEVVGSSIWAQIETPIGGFWVNDRFLGAFVTDADFRTDGRIADLLDEFAAIIRAEGDLRPVSSRRGLYVAHHAAPIRFAPSELESILTDPRTYQWPSNVVSPDDPEFADLPAQTFGEAVAASFLSAYGDSDTVLAFNEWLDSESRGIPAAAIPIPFELRGFNNVGVHDPGDDPKYEGLDWLSWYVSIDYENGEPRIVGLTIDTWAP